jgi:hypothetical protein
MADNAWNPSSKSRSPCCCAADLRCGCSDSLSLLAILITNTYDFTAGTSRALQSAGAMIVTALILLFAVLQVLYSRAMTTRGVLR